VARFETMLVTFETMFSASIGGRFEDSCFFVLYESITHGSNNPLYAERAYVRETLVFLAMLRGTECRKQSRELEKSGQRNLVESKDGIANNTRARDSYPLSMRKVGLVDHFSGRRAHFVGTQQSFEPLYSTRQSCHLAEAPHCH